MATHRNQQTLAFALNNIAVELVTKSRFEDALCILDDALQVQCSEVETVLRPCFLFRFANNHYCHFSCFQITKSIVDGSPSPDDNSLLNRARATAALSVSKNDLKNPNVQIVSSEDNSWSLPDGGQEYKVFVRADIVDLSDYDINYQTALVLYNTGVALKCCDTPLRSYNVHRLAEKLTNRPNDSNCEAFLDGKLFLLRVLMTRSLIKLSTALSFPIDNAQYVESMQEVRMQVAQGRELWASYFHIDGAAAA